MADFVRQDGETWTGRDAVKDITGKEETDLSSEHRGPFVTCAWVIESPLLASLSMMHSLSYQQGSD